MYATSQTRGERGRVTARSSKDRQRKRRSTQPQAARFQSGCWKTCSLEQQARATSASRQPRSSPKRKCKKADRQSFEREVSRTTPGPAESWAAAASGEDADILPRSPQKSTTWGSAALSATPPNVAAAAAAAAQTTTTPQNIYIYIYIYSMCIYIYIYI